MAGLKAYVFGKKIIVNLHTKRGYRVSPGANARARCLGKAARGKTLSERKQIFGSSCKVKGK